MTVQLNLVSNTVHKLNKNSILKQVNIVVACKNGHIDEFPWFEWAHGRVEGITCNLKIRI